MIFKSLTESLVLTFDDMYVGKLIDVVDYLSKWTNAIVTKLDKGKQMMQVVIDGDLEMEFAKSDIVSENDKP